MVNPQNIDQPVQFTQQEIDGFGGLALYNPATRRLEITLGGVLEVNNLPPNSALESEHIAKLFDLAFAYAQSHHHDSPIHISVDSFIGITAQIALDVLQKIQDLNLVLADENTIIGFYANESTLSQAAIDIIVNQVALENFSHLDISRVQIEGAEGEVQNSNAIKDFALAVIEASDENSLDLFIIETRLTQADSDAILAAVANNPNINYDYDNNEIIEPELELAEVAHSYDREPPPSPSPDRKRARTESQAHSFASQGGAIR